ncbi:hypothetical protein [Candidatus Leptofilum sp.]|uniref:hypothetical protein n=1 Tax=Candidatus Leptofilum sp. TaxID=3241576 RepID=UPI003B5BE7CD
MLKSLERFLPALILVLSLLLAFMWRPLLTDAAYGLLGYATQVQNMQSVSLTNLVTSPPLSPLWALVLALVNNAWLAALLGAAGWTAASLQFRQVLTSLEYPWLATLGALLLVLNPIQFSSLGLPLGWLLALAFRVVSERSRPLWHNLLSFLFMFLIWPDWSLVVLALGWVVRRHPKRWVWLLAAASSVTIVLFRSSELAWPTWGDWVAVNGRIFYESQLYWVAVPLLLWGLITIFKQPTAHTPLWLWLAWAALALLTDPLLGQAVLAVAAIWLVLLGLQEAIEWQQRQTILTIAVPADKILTAAVGSLLVAAFTMSLFMRYRLRPWQQHQAEAEIATWFTAQKIDPQTIAGSNHLGWLLNSQSVTWAEEETVGGYGMVLAAAQPEWIVSEPTLAWQQLSNSNWFKSWYDAVYETTNEERPLTLWQKSGPLDDRIPIQPIAVTTPLNLAVTGYRYDPLIMEPGGTLTVSLIMEATGSVAPFNTVINITHPAEGTPYAQVDVIAPDNISADWWQAGQSLSLERSLTVVPEIPVGAYPVTLILRETIGSEPLALYRDGDTNPLDRIVLGYVAIPWSGEPSGTVLNAAFDDGIRLYSANLEGRVSPGEQLLVTLFWQTEQTPTQNYTVFVHLVDEAGNWVAGSDSVPFNGRYPTQGWHPGSTIPHEHHLDLPPDLPPGTYFLQTGVYLPATGERLLVTTEAGEQPPNRGLLLQTFEIEP